MPPFDPPRPKRIDYIEPKLTATHVVIPHTPTNQVASAPPPKNSPTTSRYEQEHAESPTYALPSPRHGELEHAESPIHALPLKLLEDNAKNEEHDIMRKEQGHTSPQETPIDVDEKSWRIATSGDGPRSD